MNNRRHFRNRSKVRGQGLVEYAIIIALVALVSIVILAVVSMAVNRNFGLICAIMGCRVDHVGDHVLAVDRSVQDENGAPISPFCNYYKHLAPESGGTTIFFLGVYSNIPETGFFVDTDKGERISPQEATSGLGFGDEDTAHRGQDLDAIDGVRHFEIFSNTLGDNRDKCPMAMVLQSLPEYGNITVMAPVTHSCWDGPNRC